MRLSTSLPPRSSSGPPLFHLATEIRPLAIALAALVAAVLAGPLSSTAQSSSPQDGSAKKGKCSSLAETVDPAPLTPLPSKPSREGTASQNARANAIASEENEAAQTENPQTGNPQTGDDNMIPISPRQKAPRREPRSEEQLAILEARQAYQRTGDARIIRRGTQLILPYGHTQPTIKTTPLRFTLLELASGEYVKKPFIADPVRWSVDYGTTGTRGNFTQYIAVKPKRCGLAGNMAFLTNQGRVYNVTLESSPCSEGEAVDPDLERSGNGPYAIHIAFYYPDASAAEAPAPPEQARVAEGSAFPTAPPPTVLSPEAHAAERHPGRWGAHRPARAEGPSRRVRGLNPPLPVHARGSGPPEMPSVSLDDLNTAYRIDAEEGFPCTPVSASDDGRRMFVRFPTSGPQCHERFPLYAQGPDDKLRLINYTVLDGNLYVTEGVPQKAVLLYQSTGGERRLVRIRSTRLAD